MIMRTGKSNYLDMVLNALWMQWYISNYSSCETLPVYTFELSLCCLPEARWVDGEDGKCSTRRDVERLPLAQTSKLATNISISNHKYLDRT